MAKVSSVLRVGVSLGLGLGLGVGLVGNAAWAVSPTTATGGSSVAAVDATSSPAGKSARPGQAGTVAPSQLTLPPPSSTIHWAVNKDGSVELSDRPTAGNANAVRQGVERFAGSSDAESIARARRERDYWREQSEGFASRQRERDRELDQRRQAALARAEHDLYASSPYYFVPGLGLYRNRGVGGAFPVPGANSGIPLNGTFPSAAQTAALGGGPSPFLSSGFARDIRR